MIREKGLLGKTSAESNFLVLLVCPLKTALHKNNFFRLNSSYQTAFETSGDINYSMYIRIFVYIYTWTKCMYIRGKRKNMIY